MNEANGSGDNANVLPASHGISLLPHIRQIGKISRPLICSVYHFIVFDCKGGRKQLSAQKEPSILPALYLQYVENEAVSSITTPTATPPYPAPGC